ncbi:hypothetical protein HanIR_Chr04g0165631 [Helianthus annuus]|nr:hypothetical protein HanIR_Chr04g0165631 [Helianthus annuus]
MSCTSPWDWSTDPQPGQDQTSAAAWARSMFPQPAISASQWALVSNQSQSIQNLLLSESETGSNNRPPKLNHMNDFPSWKSRFHTYVQGQSTELWTCFINAFNPNLEVAASTSAGYANMLEDEKKAYDLEKKAFAILTQALTKEIYHQFSYCKDTKTLWEALVARGEGNGDRFADALPPKWSSFIKLLKHTGTLNTVNIYEFIQKL